MSGCSRCTARRIDKMLKYAEEAGVVVRAIEADLTAFEPAETYDVIFSTGTLHYLPPEVRSTRFEAYKRATAPDGVNAMSALIHKPFLPKAPDADEKAHRFRSGELLGYCWDWEILHSVEEIFDCIDP